MTVECVVRNSSGKHSSLCSLHWLDPAVTVELITIRFEITTDSTGTSNSRSLCGGDKNRCFEVLKYALKEMFEEMVFPLGIAFRHQKFLNSSNRTTKVFADEAGRPGHIPYGRNVSRFHAVLLKISAKFISQWQIWRRSRSNFLHFHEVFGKIWPN